MSNEIYSDLMNQYVKETGKPIQNGYDGTILLEYVYWLEEKIESHLTWHDEAPKNDGRYICSIGEDKYPVICAKKFENGRWLLGERKKIRWAYLPTPKEATDD